MVVVLPASICAMIPILRQWSIGTLRACLAPFLLLLSVFSGPDLEGIYIVSEYGTYKGEYKKIIADFERTYNLTATFSGGNTFSIIHTLYAAMKERGSEKENIISYFKEPRNYKTAYGDMYMDRFGDVQKKYFYIYKISNKELHSIKEFPIEY